jgi:hypothetical protein
MGVLALADRHLPPVGIEYHSAGAARTGVDRQQQLLAHAVAG